MAADNLLLRGKSNQIADQRGESKVHRKPIYMIMSFFYSHSTVQFVFTSGGSFKQKKKRSIVSLRQLGKTKVAS